MHLNINDLKFGKTVIDFTSQKLLNYANSWEFYTSKKSQTVY